MRLINTTTLDFKEYFERSIPQYAILSHTWGEQETTFQELSAGEWRSGDGAIITPVKQGIQKVIDFCAIAESDGYDWAWIDTCCINKESSAELFEAINSMYQWYHGSEVCYVHLSDLLVENGPVEAQLPSCRWFTRGWTLQELLASENVKFYDARWNFVAEEQDLYDSISAITGIDTTTLNDPRSSTSKRKDMDKHSVAQRMSWAARRTTTRKEDMAYCLLGIFGITMSLQYGEGKSAFVRLQRKILKSSPDESLFAWTHQPKTPRINSSDMQETNGALLAGMLAPHPRAFKDSADVVASGKPCSPILVTNMGMEFRVYNGELYGLSSDITRLSFPLNCEFRLQRVQLAVTLVRYKRVWYRELSRGLLELPRPENIPLFHPSVSSAEPFYVQAAHKSFSVRVPSAPFGADGAVSGSSDVMAVRFRYQSFFGAGISRSLPMDRLVAIVSKRPTQRGLKIIVSEARRLQRELGSRDASQMDFVEHATDDADFAPVNILYRDLGRELYMRQCREGAEVRLSYDGF